jgi:hypothetical protein
VSGPHSAPTKSLEKTRGRWKISTVWTSLFVGARGVVSRSCLDWTVAGFPEDACPLRRSECDVFYQSSKVKYSWKRIVGVNPLLRGASVGELGKTLWTVKTSNCQNLWDRFARVMVWRNLSIFRVFQKSLNPKCESNGRARPSYSNFSACFREYDSRRILETGTCKDLGSRTCEALGSRTCEALGSRTCEALGSRTYGVTESGICEALGSWTCEVMRSETCEVRESWYVKIFVKSGISMKPSQRCNLKSPSLTCELVAGL